MQRLLTAALLINLYACQSAPTTKQTAELMDEAAQAKAKISTAETLANEIKAAKTPEARERATANYVAASETALTDAGQTIDNLKKSLIASEDKTAKLSEKLTACEADLGIWHWVKWLLIFGGPLALFGAFMAGRKL